MSSSAIATPQKVFPTVGKPTYTYVSQDNGSLEKKLTEGISSAGQLCLLTGPSKLGKTTLYKRVLTTLNMQPVVVRCTEGLTLRNLWATALEDLDFKQVIERSASIKSSLSAEIGASGELGWGWIAKLIPSIKISGQDQSEHSYKAAVIRADISARHLIPVLKRLPVLLVIEDFHYLSETVKKELFQQWKAFIDEEVTVLVVSTTHHASDIARANPDLRGRTRHIEVDKWSNADLETIAKKGFDVLNIKTGNAFRKCIATESCGQPIVAQQICQVFSASLDLSTYSKDRRRDHQPNQLKTVFDKVVETFYADYQRDYERLLAGPRSGSRKYDTYGAILSSFALEPLEFSLRKKELGDRVASLSDHQIPTASINSSLNALSGHQKRMGTMLLEWQPAQDMLHIVEPSFLFFLKHKLREVGKNKEFVEVLKELLSKVEASLPRVKIIE